MGIWIDSLWSTLLFLLNFILLIRIFRSRKKCAVKKETVIMAVGLLAAVALGMFLSKTRMAEVFHLCYIVFYCMLTLILCRLLFSCSFRELLFCYFAVQGLMDDCFIVSKMLQSYFFRYIMRDLSSFVLSYVIVFGAALPVVFLFIRKGLRPLIDTTQGMPFWSYLWLMPISYYVVYFMGISPRYMEIQSAWTDADVVVPLFWIVASSLSYFLIVDMLLGVVRNVEDREKLKITNQQLMMQKTQYDRLRSGIEEAARIRHDLHHQMLLIAGYADKGDLPQIKKFVSEYLKVMESEEGTRLCENYAVDSIVNYYLQEAKKEKIGMSIKLEILKDLPCGESDICVILSNLLENALEACKRQDQGDRFIDLKIGTGSQSMTAIVVINSAPETADMKNGEFLSAKRNYTGPGLGISSVKRIADKYRGSADFEQENGKFCARVFLQNPAFWEKADCAMQEPWSQRSEL